MEIAGLQSSNEHVSGDFLAQTKAKDLMAPYIGEDRVQANADEATAQKKAAAAKKKEQSDKPTSVSVLNRETDVRDLVENAAQKISALQMKKMQDELQKNVRAKMENDVAAIAHTETKERVHDVAVISRAASANQSGELQRKKETERAQQFASAKGAGQAAQKTGENLAGAMANPSATQTEKKKAVGDAEEAPSAEVKDEPGVEAGLKKFVSTLAESQIRQDPVKKQEAAQIRENLLNAGISPKKLRQMEQGVQKVVAGDLRKKIREAFTKMALAYGKGKMTGDLLNSTRLFDALTDAAKKANVFGEGRGSLEEEMAEAKSDLRAFVSHELDQALAEKKAVGGSVKDIMEAFDRFNTISGMAKFDSQAYMKQFQKKLDDQGLNYFENPEKIGILDTQSSRGGGAQTGSQSQGQSDDQVEIFEEEIRSLFMQKAVKQDIRSSIEIALKLNKMKGGLKELNRYSDERIQKLRDEGEAVAKLKLTNMLKEALEERATLQGLKGTQYALVKNKMMMAMRGLKKLDAAPSKQQMMAYRDEINKSMFSVVKEEFLKVEVALEAAPRNPFLTKRRKGYLAILQRLKTESHIREDLRPKMFPTLTFTSEMKIMEAA